MASRRHSEADMKLIRTARKNLNATVDIMAQLGDDGVDDTTDASDAAVKSMEVMEWVPPTRDEVLEEKYEEIASAYGRWSQYDAHYFGADKNPFKADGIRCDNCMLYRFATPDVGVCEIVTGVVDAGGICRLWVIPSELRTDALPAIEMQIDSMSEDGMDDKAMKALRDRATTPKEREAMPASDFVFPETRNFPIVTPGDVMPAVHSWGRYRGEKTFDEFKAALVALTKRKGEEFVARLPQAWREDTAAKSISQNALDIPSTIKSWGDMTLAEFLNATDTQ